MNSKVIDKGIKLIEVHCKAEISKISILNELKTNKSIIISGNINKFLQMELLEEELLSKEKIKYERFVFEEDKKRFLLSHGILNYIFTKLLKISHKELCIIREKNYKPKINNPYNLNFNISHSGNFILIAFSLDKEVGVDIEKIDNNIEYKEISKGYFHPYDIELINTSYKNNKIKKFFEIWVAKEAYLKATGEGLAKSLNTFYICHDNDNHKYVVCCENNLKEYVFIFQYDKEHVASLCLLNIF